MDNEEPQDSSSSHQPPTASKRSSSNTDEEESSNKKMKMPDTAENVEENNPENEVQKLSLEMMLGILYNEGHFSRNPPPKRREVVGIMVPTTSKKKPILIKGSVSIGRSPSCDIVLTKYGNCANISDHHATITYDRSTGIFELLNYSRTLTIVDNFGYSNGLFTNAQPTGLWQLKDIIANRKKVTRTDVADILKELEYNDECRERQGKIFEPCDYERHLKSTFSGCAIVKHGSVLRFGCIEFIFCSIHRR